MSKRTADSTSMTSQVELKEKASSYAVEVRTLLAPTQVGSPEFATAVDRIIDLLHPIAEQLRDRPPPSHFLVKLFREGPFRVLSQNPSFSLQAEDADRLMAAFVDKSLYLVIEETDTVAVGVLQALASIVYRYPLMQRYTHRIGDIIGSAAIPETLLAAVCIEILSLVDRTDAPVEMRMAYTSFVGHIISDAYDALKDSWRNEIEPIQLALADAVMVGIHQQLLKEAIDIALKLNRFLRYPLLYYPPPPIPEPGQARALAENADSIKRAITIVTEAPVHSRRHTMATRWLQEILIDKDVYRQSSYLFIPLLKADAPEARKRGIIVLQEAMMLYPAQTLLTLMQGVATTSMDTPTFKDSQDADDTARRTGPTFKEVHDYCIDIMIERMRVAPSKQAARVILTALWRAVLNGDQHNGLKDAVRTALIQFAQPPHTPTMAKQEEKLIVQLFKNLHYQQNATTAFAILEKACAESIEASRLYPEYARKLLHHEAMREEATNLYRTAAIRLLPPIWLGDRVTGQNLLLDITQAARYIRLLEDVMTGTGFRHTGYSSRFITAHNALMAIATHAPWTKKLPYDSLPSTRKLEQLFPTLPLPQQQELDPWMRVRQALKGGRKNDGKG